VIPWNDLPHYGKDVQVAQRVLDNLKLSPRVPQYHLVEFARFASQVIESDERVLAAFRVAWIWLNGADGSKSRIVTPGRGAPRPIVIFTDRRLIIGRYHLGLRSVDSHWSWIEIQKVDIESVSEVHRGRFEAECLSKGVAVKFVFELWLFRMKLIRSVRDTVARSV